MGSVIYATAASLDGYVADRSGTLDWLEGLEHDPDGPGGFREIDARAGAMVMGRATYDWVSAALARTGEAWPHRQPCWVRTRRPIDDPVPGAVLHTTDRPAVETLAAVHEVVGDADVWCVGGGQTATWLCQAGLVDEICVAIAPVVLGDGVPLLGFPVSLELVEVARNGALTAVRYRVVASRP